MKRGTRYALALALILLSVPALAVFNEKDLGQTISVLRYELRQEYDKMASSRDRLQTRNDAQHHRMVGMIKTCNELSLMLYSQKQDLTFDMTYALKSVTREYEEFNEHKMPFDDILARLDLEIDRYSRLVESLRRLPPQLEEKTVDLPDSLKYHNDTVNFDIDIPDLVEVPPMPAAVKDSLMPLPEVPVGTFVLDSLGQADRDSCLLYATSLLKMYSESRDKIIEDNEHYQEASDRLKESYDYAQERYKVLQKRIFIDGQTNYFTIIGSFGRYLKSALSDAHDKYDSTLVLGDTEVISNSEWRGPKVLGFVSVIVLFIVVAAFLSIFVIRLLSRWVRRFRDEEFKGKRSCLTLLCASALFAISLMVVSRVVDQNFFKVASSLLLALAWLMAAIMLSLYIRLDASKTKPGMKMYFPVLTAGFVIIVFRIVFIPNTMVNLLLPPVLLLFTLWQLHVCRRIAADLPSADGILGWVTLFVFAASTVVAWVGYVFVAILIMIWWLFQVSAIESVSAIDVLLERYNKKYLAGRKTGLRATWFHDLVDKVGVPVITILSVPFCIKMAADVFDFTGTFRDLFYKPLIALYDTSANPILHISLFKLVLVVSLFFCFRYLVYVLKTVYHDYRLAKEKRRSGGAHIHTNQINFTLANNIIGILAWGIYIVMIILLCKIPVGAISVIFAGLATGLGLAMKDILNNFIYGIQLMSGRLRVGDWVECDGVRGKVMSISYQSTQIETADGAVMSFLNTALFNQNFKNLTRNNSYEFVKITVGVNYGADVERVRGLLLEALQSVCSKDAYGRDIVDPKRGLSVVFDEFGDSSVDLAVKQFVLVAERAGYIARAKEVIYNTLNANNIEIPFPQRDIHIIKAE